MINHQALVTRGFLFVGGWVDLIGEEKLII